MKMKSNPECQILVSMNTSCDFKNTCYLTKVNFITDDRMLRFTYLYENIMVANKVRHNIIWVRKEKITLR